MAPIARLLNIAEYCGARLFLFLAQALPLRSALRMGEGLGRLIAAVGRRRMRLAVDNLRHAYPDLSPKEAREMAVRVCEHFGRAMVESALAPRMLRRSTFRRHVVIRSEEHLRQALSSDRGAIFVAAHLGVWEIFGLVLHFMDKSCHFVYRPVKNPLIERLVRKRRRALRQITVPRRGALRKLLRVLRDKGYIGLVVDQHAKRDGVWVPFFGRPASTTPAPALLALRTGAPIVCGYARRLPGTYRFELLLDEPVYAEPTGDRAADVERITRQISQRLEDYVRQFPEQWLWLHRRWHTPPPEIVEKGRGDVRPSGQVD